MRLFFNLLKSDFSKNVLTLMTGTTISQAIPIAITPILTRLYSPDDFGILALFMSITAVLGVVANGKFEQAIMLPNTEKEALSIVYLSVIISSIFSILLLVIVLIFKSKIASLLGNSKIENWLLFIPISVLFIGLFNSLKIYNIRIKNFKLVSVSMVTKSSGLVVTQLGIGFVKSGALGLIIGQLVSYIAGNLQLLKTIVKNNLFKNTFDKNNIKLVTKKYNRFPKYTLPGSLLNSLTINSISFLIVAIYTTSILGFFSLAKRLLSLPSMVIGGSISQVYFQKLSETKNKEGNTLKVFTKFLTRLLLVSLPIYTVAYFIVVPTFKFFFGEEWIIAGEYAKIIVPLACAGFVSSTLSSTLHVFQKQQITLFIQATQFITILIVFWVSNLYQFNFIKTLSVYSIIFTFEYMIFALVYWQIVKKNN
ncbi:MAG: oligosaccharide flippase family protein [Flavobacteriaceae bacterium]|nr:oligosaccharide flippase family protein [Flavobacteriaceae bacterium]